MQTIRDLERRKNYRGTHDFDQKHNIIFSIMLVPRNSCGRHCMSLPRRHFIYPFLLLQKFKFHNASESRGGSTNITVKLECTNGEKDYLVS